MPTRRSRRTRNWPTGLYDKVVKGKTYYRFRDPVLKRWIGLGADFEVAREAAANRNAEIAVSPIDKYTDKLAGTLPNKSFADGCAAFLADVATRRSGRGDIVTQRSDNTLRDYASYCRRFEVHFKPNTLIRTITLAQINEYLDGYGTAHRGRNMARGLLVQIWTVCISKGWLVDNLPERTLVVKHAVARKRLSLEQFNSVVAAADPWLAAACKFALYCDQRRGDVSTVLNSAWNPKKGVLSFEQEKTGHVVRIDAGPKLRAAIEACLALNPKNAKTIIRKPGRKDPVSDEMLTRGFQLIRDDLILKKHKAWKGFKDDTKGKPSWHEVRSLGAALAKKAGLDAKNLAGHDTEQMAAMYQEGHAQVFEATSL